ncbi:MAG: DUF262 domain-containing protein [Muribaculaceae bacterium]|nr:DUF262 domain-containing protein [Muribaculaceae bacterium]
MENIALTTRKVADIEGEFVLPDYQRGYRWTNDEIKLLLNDIYENGNKPYCLQPIVVKKRENGKYELIDGQQRLTTIYLIYKYLQSKFGSVYTPPFSLSYETREKSGAFLENIEIERRNENIDFFFIAQAYEYIRDYFELDADGNPTKLKPGRLTMLNEYFENQVSVIWYEVDSQEDGIALFERLNIGKIPLTSSELVKALFMRDSSKDEISHRQEEISLQWDSMENSLRESSFWNFLTNEKPSTYPTRIDLILDIISGKDQNTREKYHTFFHFDNRIKELKEAEEEFPLIRLWAEIYHVYLTLREWYLNHEFYHKIGYLINAGYKTISELYQVWRGKDTDPLPKDKFLQEIDKMIRDSIELMDREELDVLSYTADNEKIRNVLLLFNVETERRMDEKKRRFPFDKHKDSFWSLEHIHAQHSVGLETNDKIHTWIKAHLKLLKSGAFGEHSELITRMDAFVEELENSANVSNARKRLQEMQTEANRIFTPGDTVDKDETYRDNIANLALLDTGQNAALSNYVFDAKRDIIIGYDKEGKYIPICTKMVFFKYYSPTDATLHFWGESDRSHYMESIHEIIKPYYKTSTKFNNENNDTEESSTE